jgi:SAM-dependent methyltransferase
MTDVARHYSGGQDLVARILDLLRAAGKDVDRLTIDDLAPFDEFHVRGREATTGQLQRLALAPGMRVLDVGSGIGGPARRIAATAGCRVVGIDLTPEFVRVASELARRVGLADRVTFQVGDATRLAFVDSSFDAVWTQHVQMNIADKRTFYGEIARVLKPGGRFACYEVLLGPRGDPIYPAPWAAEPATSHLMTPARLREELGAAGLAVEHWHDATADGRAWFEQRRAEAAAASAAGKPPPPSPAALLGGVLPTAMGNMLRNFLEERVALVEAIARKPGHP